MTTGGPADLRLGPTVAPPIPMILPSDTAKRSSTNVHCHNSFRVVLHRYHHKLFVVEPVEALQLHLGRINVPFRAPVEP